MDVRRVLGAGTIAPRERKPPWFKVRAPGGPRYRELTRLIEGLDFHHPAREESLQRAAIRRLDQQMSPIVIGAPGDQCARRP